MTETNTRRNLSVATSLELVRAMQQRPMTVAQLAELGGVRDTTVRTFLRQAAKLVHVGDWLPDSRGRLFSAGYVWGAGKDAPRPGRRSAADRQRRYRDRQRSAA